MWTERSSILCECLSGMFTLFIGIFSISILFLIIICMESILIFPVSHLPVEISSLVHLQEPWFRTAFLTACSSLSCCFWKVLRKWSVPCFGTVPLCLLFWITVTTESAKPLPVSSAFQLACQTVWWEPVGSFAVPVYRWLDALLLPSAIPTQSPIGAGTVTPHVGLTGLYHHSVLSWILSWDFAL